jgi:hypothetical protein
VRGAPFHPAGSTDELAVIRALTVALVEGRWRAGSWTDAEQQAVDFLDQLRGNGFTLVRWTS